MLDKLRKLCTPAFIYFVLSAISIIILLAQNMGNTTRYCVGEFSCNVPNTATVFIAKILYVLFWTWALDVICKHGYKSVSWFLVLFPFILFFVLLGLLLLNQGTLVA